MEEMRAEDRGQQAEAKVRHNLILVLFRRVTIKVTSHQSNFTSIIDNKLYRFL